MWKVERDKVVVCRQVVAPYIVGTYRWRWVAVVVAWALAHGWWGCYVSEADE
jgi:hypothetical protein